YYPINPLGDGLNAQEFYKTPRPSIYNTSVNTYPKEYNPLDRFYHQAEPDFSQPAVQETQATPIVESSIVELSVPQRFVDEFTNLSEEDKQTLGYTSVEDMYN